MADARDILLGGRGPAGPAEAPKPEKKKEEKMKRPEGMSREAFALLGGSHPIAPSQLMDGLKKKKDKQHKPKPSSKGTVIFRLKPFKNQARTDGLELVHWVKGYKDATGRVRDADEGDYAFAKYNKKVQLFRYDDEEYATLVAKDDAASGWSKQETDYLFDLCELYDLRFVVIHDRYDFPGGPARSMEDLKERYYGIARRLLMEREGKDAMLFVHPVLRQPYNAAHERARKAALLALQKRDPEREEQENAVLERARVVEERRKAELAAAQAAQQAAAAAARKLQTTPSGVPRPFSSKEMPFDPSDLRYPQDFPNNPGPNVPTLFTPNVTPLHPPPGVYVRGQHTRDTALSQSSSLTGNSQRVQKLVEAALQEVHAPLHHPRINTRNVAGNFLALRGEVFALVEARQAAAKRAADAKKERKRKADESALQRHDKRQRIMKKYE